MMKRFMEGSKTAGLYAAMMALMLWFAPTTLAAATPSIVAVSSATYVTQLASAGSTWVPGKVAIDSKGNAFVADIGIGAVWEIPATGATPFIVESGLGGINGVAVDAAGTLYANQTYSGNVYAIPLVNGSYSTGAQVNLVKNFGALDGYYMQPTDMAVDTKGHAYFACGAAGCAGNHSLFQVNTDGSNPVILLKSMPNALTGIAVNTLGTVYYADGVKVYAVDTTASVPAAVAIGTGFTAPKGVTVDAANNLYIADSTLGAIFVIPFQNGALNPAAQYTLALGVTAGFSPGLDALGNMYIGDQYASRSVRKLTLGAGAFPATAVGATSGIPVTFTFNTATTPASIAYLQGTGNSAPITINYGSCGSGTAQAAGTSCTQNVNFKPTTAGLQTAAIVLRDSSGKALATAYLSGVGTGAGLSFDPGVQTTLPLSTSASLVNPVAVAYDAAGAAYVVDSSTNQIVVYSAAGGSGVPIPGTTLSLPAGIAVDAAGNVIVADTGNNRLVAIPNIANTLSGANQIVLATGLKSPQGVAIGPDGGIFVADTGNTRVLRFATWQGWGSLQQTTVGSGYGTPVGLAVDGSNVLSVADKTTNSIFRVNTFTGGQVTALGALSAPTSVGLDGAGNLYVVNSGTRSVSRYLNKAGIVDPNSGIQISSSFSIPTSVAVNNLGNAVVADSGSQQVYGLQRTAGAINFGPVNFGNSSAPNQIVLTNSGNLPLILNTPYYTEAGAPANYSLVASSTAGCASGATLAAGTSCGLNASFVPLITGTVTDTLSFSSNSASATTPSVSLTGIGTNLSPTTIALAQTSPAAGTTIVYGQPLTVTASVISTKAGFTPTGNVTFNLDGQRDKTLTLTTASPYTASDLFAALSGGVHSVSATYNGDANNATSNTTTPLSITVVKANAKLAFSVSPTIAIAPGDKATFSITATSTTSGTPTGTVNILSGGTVIGTGSLSATGQVVTVVNGQTVPGIVVTTLPLGVYTITAQYLGDVNFNAATSTSTVGVTVRYPDFDIQMGNTALTVKAGSSGSVPVTFLPVSGYGGVNPAVFNAVVFPGFTFTPPTGIPVVTPACSGLPANATCTFVPGYANFNALSPATVAMTINTNVTSNTTVPYPSGIPWIPGLLGGLGMLLAMAASPKQWRRRSMRFTALVVMLAAGLMATSGCGSGIRLTPTYNVTPAGNYPLVVTFSGAQNGGSQTFNATLTPGSNVITGVSSFGSLSVGDTILTANPSQPNWPTGTVITAMSYASGTITTSAALLCQGGGTACTPTPTLQLVTVSNAVIVHTVNVQLTVQ